MLLALWQGMESSSLSASNTRWLMIFVGLVALAMVTQAIVVVALGVGAWTAKKRMMAVVEEMRVKAAPVIDQAQGLVAEAIPKIRVITDNLVETSTMVKKKAAELDSTLTDANQKTRAQVARVDGMVTTALTTTGQLAEMIHQGIRTPVLEVLGVVNGAKAALDVLMSKSKSFTEFGMFGRRKF